MGRLIGLLFFLCLFALHRAEQSKCSLATDIVTVYVYRNIDKLGPSRYYSKVESVETCVCDAGFCIAIFAVRPTVCSAVVKMSPEEVEEFCPINQRAPKYMCEGTFSSSTPTEMEFECGEVSSFV
ncbi:hypothetical protein M514_01541 [Trichuris suis]|uniref:Uncharacterized protein n=1 Tax=Trichuris suis TaxID=68888 RepID=A0A085NAP8_9BILA|nr:hypothetical protein M513_01541 [Trichuris suis]KFD66544.1 hypothetical protein M514_01541 [Trichuris suis]KHJ49099.1 hypothetical protein D918_00217 [Trichuris suis]